MAAILTVFSGVFGAVVGSFLSVVAKRLPRGEEIVWQRSRCPTCQSAIAPRDLIPLVSFVRLRGRCRVCRGALHWRYPLLEILTAALFGLTTFACADEVRVCMALWPIPVWWFFEALLVLIAVIDAETRTIPTVLLEIGILGALLARLTFDPSTLVNALGGGVAAGGGFWILVMVSRERWLGRGDAELGFLGGLLVGFPHVLMLLTVAGFSGALWGIVLVASGRKTWRSEVPFAPFLVLGIFAVLFVAPFTPLSPFSLFLPFR